MLKKNCPCAILNGIYGKKLNRPRLDGNFYLEPRNLIFFPRHTHGACFATSLGAVIHELGHSLDLVHSDEGIMARGFDDLNIYFLANVSELVDDGNYPKESCSKSKPKLSYCSNHDKGEEEGEDAKPRFTSLGSRTRGQELLDGYHERKFYSKLKNDFGGAFWCRSHALILDSHM